MGGSKRGGLDRPMGLSLLTVAAVYPLMAAITALGCNFQGPLDVYLPRSGQVVQANVIMSRSDAIQYAVHEDLILGKLECVCEEHQPTGCAIDFVPLGAFAPSSETKESQPLELRRGEGHPSDRQLEAFLDHWNYRWADAVVYYEIAKEITSPVREAIHAAAWAWTQNSPARFVQSSRATDRVVFRGYEEEICASSVGRTGGQQTLAVNLHGGCGIGKLIHELGHVLGWQHEHVRPDRDEYVTVREEYVLDGHEDNFAKERRNGVYSYGEFPYDFGSVMHYPKNGFANSGHATIEVNEEKYRDFKQQYPNDLPGGEIGQRFMMSTIDKQIGYSNLAGCYKDHHLTKILNEEEPSWYTSPWGACSATLSCNGTAFRERFVTCRKNGYCRDEIECDPVEMPPTRQPCELSPENLHVTFDEELLGDIGVPFANALYYDQYDWNIWSGALPHLQDSGKKLTTDFHGDGPIGDASPSGDGRYLWFTSWNPAQKNDQAWYESPVVATTNHYSCTLDFDWFIQGSSGKLIVELVSCANCKTREEIWESEGTQGEWIHSFVEIPRVEDHQVRVRFTAVRGQSRHGNIGLDNIIFSESCIRTDYNEVVAALQTSDPAGEMFLPYQNLEPECIYYNPRSVSMWSKPLVILALLGSFLPSFCILLGIFECIIRKRYLRRLLSEGEQHSGLEIKRAATILKALGNPHFLSKIVLGAPVKRVNSIRSFQDEKTISVKGSSLGQFQKSDNKRHQLSSESLHRNKSMRTWDGYNKVKVVKQTTKSTEGSARRCSTSQHSATSNESAPPLSVYLPQSAMRGANTTFVNDTGLASRMQFWRSTWFRHNIKFPTRRESSLSCNAAVEVIRELDPKDLTNITLPTHAPSSGLPRLSVPSQELLPQSSHRNCIQSRRDEKCIFTQEIGKEKLPDQDLPTELVPNRANNIASVISVTRQSIEKSSGEYEDCVTLEAKKPLGFGRSGSSQQCIKLCRPRREGLSVEDIGWLEETEEESKI